MLSISGQYIFGLKSQKVRSDYSWIILMTVQSSTFLLKSNLIIATVLEPLDLPVTSGPSI